MKNLKDILTEAFLIKKHQNKINDDCVDLDLPSGTKWCTHNLGANKPEDYGLLFQWGRTDGYKYNDKNHKFLSKDNYVTTSGTKYKKGDVLKPEDDAVYQATKGRFIMPTEDDIDELIKYTDNEWTDLNGVKGYKFISKKDESKWIFIPAAGCFYGDNGSFDNAEINACVWSVSVTPNFAGHSCYLTFHSDKCYCGYYYDHYCSFSVRGVLNK